MTPIKCSIFNHDPVTEEGRALRLTVHQRSPIEGVEGKRQAILLPGSDQGVILLDGTNRVTLEAMPQGADVSLRMARGTPGWLQGQAVAALERVEMAIAALSTHLPEDGAQFALVQASVKQVELRTWLVQAITSKKIGVQG